MVDLTKPRSLLRNIIAGAAERIAMQPWVPPENREAMRITAISIFEQQISAVVGYDSIVVSGWVMPPSQRMERRERIEAALAAGESAKSIAGRELVSERWVRMVRAEMPAGACAEVLPPEQFHKPSSQ